MREALVLTLPPAEQWDHAIVGETLARCPGWTFRHVTTLPPGCDGAVVVVPGRYPDAEHRTQRAVAGLRWAIVFVTGDEEATYRHELVVHPNLRWWHQLPRPGWHDFARRFGDGPAPHLRPLLRALGPHVERVHDWSFAGQVNHKRRRELVEVLERTDGGSLLVSGGFTQGLAHDDYARLLASTKVVPCPSGKHTPDTFRLFEALEAGCVPVADGLCYGWASDGYWDYLFGETPPFPVVKDSWASFPGLLSELLDGWQERANAVQAWWLAKRREMAWDLADDLVAVGAA